MAESPATSFPSLGFMHRLPPMTALSLRLTRLKAPLTLFTLLSSFAQADILAEPMTAVASKAGPFQIGQPASPESIKAIDIDILPDGRGLPAGSGSVTEGAEIYANQCAACHGLDGQGGPHPALAGAPEVSAAELSADRNIPHTIGNYWGYATTLFSYIRRAMPFDRPGSLSDSQVYALSAYLLYLNDLVAENAAMDANTLPKVAMPAHKFYRPVSPKVADDRTTSQSESSNEALDSDTNVGANTAPREDQ